MARWRTSARRAPLDVLDDGVGLAVLVGRRLEHLRDAGVMELRLDARLVEEAREERPVVDVVAPHRLDDARALGALDAGRRGEVDVAHPAARHELEEERRPSIRGRASAGAADENPLRSFAHRNGHAKKRRMSRPSFRQVGLWVGRGRLRGAQVGLRVAQTRLPGAQVGLRVGQVRLPEGQAGLRVAQTRLRVAQVGLRVGQTRLRGAQVGPRVGRARLPVRRRRPRLPDRP